MLQKLFHPMKLLQCHAGKTRLYNLWPWYHCCLKDKPAQYVHYFATTAAPA